MSSTSLASKGMARSVTLSVLGLIAGSVEGAPATRGIEAEFEASRLDADV